MFIYYYRMQGELANLFITTMTWFEKTGADTIQEFAMITAGLVLGAMAIGGRFSGRKDRLIRGFSIVIGIIALFRAF